MKRFNKVSFMAKSVIVASLYVVLTVICYPLSYGAVQFRFSELMTLLAFVDPLYVPGLLLGCFLANLLGIGGIIDAVFGTCASIFALFFICLCKRLIKNENLSLIIASLFPAISSFIIAYEMTFVLNDQASFWFWTAMIALGQFCVVTLVGVPLFSYIEKKPHLMSIIKKIRE